MRCWSKARMRKKCVGSVKLFNVVQLVLWSPVSDVECPLSVTDSGILAGALKRLPRIGADRCTSYRIRSGGSFWKSFAFLVAESEIPWMPSFWEDPASPASDDVVCLLALFVSFSLSSSSPASLHSYAWAVPVGIQPFSKASSHLSRHSFQSSSEYFDSERARPLSDETARSRATEKVPAPGPYMYYTRAAHGTNSRASFVRRTYLYPAKARNYHITVTFCAPHCISPQ
jgi:hypothetical protein